MALKTLRHAEMSSPIRRQGALPTVELQHARRGCDGRRRRGGGRRGGSHGRQRGSGRNGGGRGRCGRGSRCGPGAIRGQVIVVVIAVVVAAAQYQNGQDNDNDNDQETATANDNCGKEPLVFVFLIVLRFLGLLLLFGWIIRTITLLSLIVPLLLSFRRTDTRQQCFGLRFVVLAITVIVHLVLFVILAALKQAESFLAATTAMTVP
mmetsp:Transcript_25375/g.59468  ORF Transcript_25375/g.59468 Transcript_25375/m.59468 type:complete len:207 (+) Transcript_25375:1049-1669(+)